MICSRLYIHLSIDYEKCGFFLLLQKDPFSNGDLLSSFLLVLDQPEMKLKSQNFLCTKRFMQFACEGWAPYKVCSYVHLI